MRKILWSSLLFFCGTLLNACQPGNRLPVVVITTSAGEITATIDTVRAPISGANFMKLVDAGAYDTGATFYRVVRPDNQPDNDVKIDVIQGGLRNDSSVGNLTPIAHETTEATGLKHLDGTLSMARSEPGSFVGVFHLHRRPTRTGFQRQAQPGRTGLRRIRPGNRRNGCRPANPTAAGFDANPHRTGQDRFDPAGTINPGESDPEI